MPFHNLVILGKLIAVHRSILRESLACAALCVELFTSSISPPGDPSVGDGLPFSFLDGTGGGGIGSAISGAAGSTGVGAGRPGREDAGSPALAFSTSFSLPRTVSNWGARDWITPRIFGSSTKLLICERDLTSCTSPSSSASAIPAPASEADGPILGVQKKLLRKNVQVKKDYVPWTWKSNQTRNFPSRCSWSQTIILSRSSVSASEFLGSTFWSCDLTCEACRLKCCWPCPNVEQDLG